MSDPCAFTGCPKPAAMHSNGDRRSPWCQGHLKQRQRVGEAGMKPLRERLNRDTCAFPGCLRKPRTRPQKSRPRSLYCAQHKDEADEPKHLPLDDR